MGSEMCIRDRASILYFSHRVLFLPATLISLRRLPSSPIDPRAFPSIDLIAQADRPLPVRSVPRAGADVRAHLISVQRDPRLGRRIQPKREMEASVICRRPICLRHFSGANQRDGSTCSISRPLLQSTASLCLNRHLTSSSSFYQRTYLRLSRSQVGEPATIRCSTARAAP